jgi:S1-C subfamily serine protease
MRVFLFGYPGGDSTNSTLSSGIVQRLVMREAGGRQAQFVQHEARGGPGTGGGPLVNACGAVLGVNGFLLQGGAGLAVVALELALAAKQRNIAYAVAPACNR